MKVKVTFLIITKRGSFDQARWLCLMDFDLPELAAVSSNSLELLTIETGEELTNKFYTL